MRIFSIVAALAICHFFSAPLIAYTLQDNSSDAVSKAVKAKPEKIKKDILIVNDLKSEKLTISTENVKFKSKKNGLLMVVSPLAYLMIKSQMNSDKGFLLASLDRASGEVEYFVAWDSSDSYRTSDYRGFSLKNIDSPTGAVSLLQNTELYIPSQWVSSTNGPFTNQTLMPARYEYKKRYGAKIDVASIAIALPNVGDKQNDALEIYLFGNDEAKQGVMAYRFYPSEITAFIETVDAERLKLVPTSQPPIEVKSISLQN